MQDHAEKEHTEVPNSQRAKFKTYPVKKKVAWTTAGLVIKTVQDTLSLIQISNPSFAKM